MTGGKVDDIQTKIDEKKLKELEDEYFEALTGFGRVHRAHREYYKFSDGEHFEALLRAVNRAEKEGHMGLYRFIIASEVYFARKIGEEDWEFYDDLNESHWFDSDDYEDYDDLKLSEFLEKHKEEVIEAFKNAIKEAKETAQEIQGVDGYEYDVRAGIIVEN